MAPGLRRTFYWTNGILYLTGLIYFLWASFLRDDESDSSWRWIYLETLHLHSIVGLWFIGVFGYIYAKHIEPGRRSGRYTKSGDLIYYPTVLLFITVPGIFYISLENIRHGVALMHSIVGVAVPLFFLPHFLDAHRNHNR